MTSSAPTHRHWLALGAFSGFLGLIGTIDLALPGQAEAAGGAFVVDDAAVGKPGNCKVELWASFADNSDRNAVTDPACVFDLGKPVEIGMQLQHARASGEWSTSLGPKLKVNILPVETGKIGLGLAGGTSVDLTTNGPGNSFVNVPATLALHEDFKINVNAGWLHEGATNLQWMTWGAGIEWQFKKPFMFIAEVFGQAGHDVPGQPSISGPRMQAGLRYTPKSDIDVDVIYGRNIAGENANWITVGLNLRFGE